MFRNQNWRGRKETFLPQVFFALKSWWIQEYFLSKLQHLNVGKATTLLGDPSTSNRDKNDGINPFSFSGSRDCEPKTFYRLAEDKKNMDMIVWKSRHFMTDSIKLGNKEIWSVFAPLPCSFSVFGNSEDLGSGIWQPFCPKTNWPDFLRFNSQA